MSYRFKPRLIPTLVTLIILPVLLKLGFWQLDRAEEKRVLQQTFNSRITGEAVPVNEITDWNDQQLRYQKVSFSGYFDNQHHLLLDNQTYQGQVGYHVITPLQLPDGQLLLVNRGWIPLGSSRQVLPSIEPVTEHVHLQGLLKPIEKKPFILKDVAEDQEQWPRRIQYIKLSQLQEKLNNDIVSFEILLLPGEPHGFGRDWQPVNMLPEKHQAYAFQWFALAATLVIIFIVVNIRHED